MFEHTVGCWSRDSLRRWPGLAPWVFCAGFLEFEISTKLYHDSSYIVVYLCARQGGEGWQRAAGGMVSAYQKPAWRLASNYGGRRGGSRRRTIEPRWESIYPIASKLLAITHCRQWQTPSHCECRRPRIWTSKPMLCVIHSSHLLSFHHLYKEGVSVKRRHSHLCTIYHCNLTP